MSHNFLLNLQDGQTAYTRYRFWLWQLGFWLFMCVVAFFILILWYAEANAATVGHVLMQAVVGLICSLFLHYVFGQLDHIELASRFVLGLFLVLACAFIWTISHMHIFVLFTGFDDVWDEFGGWYFSGIFIFLCWTGLFHWIRYYDLLQFEHRIMLKAEATSREEHFKRLQAQSEARDAKLKMLRYQLNPHFLCNTLNAINSLIEIGESQKAQNMTVQLSEFLRYSLDNDPDTKIQLIDEIEALSLYLEIEKTRFGDRLKVEMNISHEAESALVPSLLLQPIIENSMKHAIARNIDGGTISILASVEGNNLNLSLKDSGNGELQKAALSEMLQIDSKGKGVGLKNTNQRLKALYQDCFSIHTVFEESGGLSTHIVIPLEKE